MNSAANERIRSIPLELLVSHEENSNHMAAPTLAKLQRHIVRTGRYEPLVVRPHPSQEGHFQILNGHHRRRALRNIGEAAARCVVWDVDDAQAHLYLATLNRLVGEEIPERRAVLLERLAGELGLDELSGLLPETERQLQRCRSCYTTKKLQRTVARV